jgi:hypothetical protein
MSKKSPISKLEKIIRSMIREEIEIERNKPKFHTVSLETLLDNNTKFFNSVMPKLTKQPKEN